MLSIRMSVIQKSIGTLLYSKSTKAAYSTIPSSVIPPPPTTNPSTTDSAPSVTAAKNQLADQLKDLMRSVPQPVSLATVLIPPASSTIEPIFHAATLSSLTSISLSPPQLCFSLRLPSRLASSLSHRIPSLTPNVVLHYLSSSQMSIAAAFARPTPLSQDWIEDANRTESFPSNSPFGKFAHQITKEGIPVFEGCIGAISCRIVGSVPLTSTTTVDVNDGEVKSELFVAEVVRVEESAVSGRIKEGSDGPLVYLEQGYWSVKPLVDAKA